MGQVVTGACPGPAVAGGGVTRVMLILLLLRWMMMLLLLSGNPGPDSGLVNRTGAGLRRWPMVVLLVIGLLMSCRRM